MTLLYIILGATLLAFAYFVITAAGPVIDMYQNRLVYRANLSRAEQALVEKQLNRLARVIVMCDRVDRPERGFLDAVKDNFTTGVKYVFLVSNRSTDQQLDQYREIFTEIGAAVRAEGNARKLIGEDVLVFDDPLFEVHRLKQNWSDYPYICYEFICDASAEPSSRYLMYRGSEIGVGIAPEYHKVSPEIAHSLIMRADALKAFIIAEREEFDDGRGASLANKPAFIQGVIAGGRGR